jgi:hypothetical protein
MYQRYLGGNMDEGWTRWLLEDFDFPYTSIMDDVIQAGNLINRFDVIILPADNVSTMTGEPRADGSTPRGGDASAYPPDYRSGLGESGVAALEEFVEAGGTLVTFAQAGSLAIDKFDLPVRNTLAGVSSTEFWSPGSTLKVKVHNDNPLAFGMPDRTLVAFLAQNQVYEVVPGAKSHTVTRIVEFIDRDLLESGWLLGEQRIANKATMVSVEHGEGTVVLIGFRPQHRSQTHGTFKLLFNALVSGGSAAAIAVDGAGS